MLVCLKVGCTCTIHRGLALLCLKIFAEKNKSRALAFKILLCGDVYLAYKAKLAV
jgi:hypothetical protein